MSATGTPSTPCRRMNAFWASENCDALLSSAPPSQGNLPRKSLTLNGPVFGEQISRMPRYRTAYPPEFRRQLVDLVRSGRTPEELAREFEPTAQSISTWVKQAERDAGKRIDGPTSAERDELVRLRRENHRLRQERDILAKAAA